MRDFLRIRRYIILYLTDSTICIGLDGWVVYACTGSNNDDAELFSGIVLIGFTGFVRFEGVFIHSFHSRITNYFSLQTQILTLIIHSFIRHHTNNTYMITSHHHTPSTIHN